MRTRQFQSFKNEVQKCLAKMVRITNEVLAERISNNCSVLHEIKDNLKEQNGHVRENTQFRHETQTSIKEHSKQIKENTDFRHKTLGTVGAVAVVAGGLISLLISYVTKLGGK